MMRGWGIPFVPTNGSMVAKAVMVNVRQIFLIKPGHAALKLFARHHIGLLEFERKRLKRHRLVVRKVSLANGEKS